MRTLLSLLGANGRIVTRTPNEAGKIFSEFNEPNEGVRILPCVSGVSDELACAVSEEDVVILDPPYSEEIGMGRSGPAWQVTIDRLRGAGKRVVFFTDENEPTAHDCDLLINDHPWAADFEGAYREMGYTGKYLGGAQYFLIDRLHRTAPKNSDKLFVSFGGGDQSGLLERFGEILRQLARKYPMEVVLGPGVLDEKLECAGVKIHRALPPGEFAAKLAGAKLVLTAAGNTLFERVFHRAAGISLSQSSHQETLGRAFHDLGVTYHLGLGREIAPERLA